MKVSILGKRENINNDSTSVNSKNIIYDITPFTALDYPDKLACILWFAGCNMRCSYCYNPEIVHGKGNLTNKQVLKFVRSRNLLLDGVVFSGGECTIHKELPDIVYEVKKCGFLVKIDTNGSNPDCLQLLIDNQLIDYVALDFKALPDKTYKITQRNLFSKFAESLAILQNSSIPFEVRTTVHSQFFSRPYINKMVNFLETAGYTGIYYLQNFRNDCNTLGNLINDNGKYLINNFIQYNIHIEIRNL